MRPSGAIRQGPRRAAWIAALVALILMPGCDGVHITFLDPQGPVAAQQRTHFLIILGLMLVVVLPVLVLTPWLAWRYRYGKHQEYKPEWNFAWTWEIVLWSIPAVIVTVLAVFLWRNTLALDPYRPLDLPGEPLRVQAVATDWKWLFIYPDLGIASVDELVFPVERQIALHLTSDTVMQAFFIPALGSQIYAMGGMVTRLHLAADAPGRFRGRNTQYNGLGFHTQRFEAVALSEGDFAAWLAGARAAAPLDAEAYAVLARAGTAGAAAEALGRTLPLRFGAVHEGLFARIVSETAEGAGQ